jgi:hypothetical protein
MAPSHAGAPRRRGAGGLARRPRRGLFVAEALRLPPEIASIAFVSILETAADKFVGLTRRAGAELAGLDEPDPTLVRHLHNLHALREHYDAAEVIALARAVMLADAKAYGNQFPAYRGTRCAKRCAPSKASRPILATLGGLRISAADGVRKRGRVRSLHWHAEGVVRKAPGRVGNALIRSETS